MHLALYKGFSDARAVIHAHPYWMNVFVAAEKPVVSILENTRKFGPIEYVKQAPGCSGELAENVLTHFKAKQTQWEKTALMGLLPRHGIVAMGRNMNAAFDILDRMESDCRCQILGRLFKL